MSTVLNTELQGWMLRQLGSQFQQQTMIVKLLT